MPASISLGFHRASQGGAKRGIIKPVSGRAQITIRLTDTFFLLILSPSTSIRLCLTYWSIIRKYFPLPWKYPVPFVCLLASADPISPYFSTN